MKKLLNEICKPKQWKTISTSDLLKEGYSVYGANGVIGFYNEYTHKEPTLMITCRGATCGTLNISKPFSYINGNAMALDDLDKDVDMKFLYYYLSNRGLRDTISGSAQPQITRIGLSKVEIEYPNIEIQLKIVDVLDKAQGLIDKRKKQLIALEQLVKSRFIDMFGNPATNSKGWVVEELSECLINIENGKSFVCENFSREGEYPAILKLSAVTYGTYDSSENKALTGEDLFVGSVEVKNGDLLFTRKNTPELVGMSAYVYETSPKLMMPDLIFRLNTNKKCNKVYLWKLINHDFFRENIKALSNGSAKSMSNISKERLMKLNIPLPPIELQKQFADFVKQVNKLKFEMEESLKELENNFNSLMQRAFKGELFN
ncbi:restriction endonuclease subunit S [Clostridium lundense]|uniref:restriction endonuclease subunit S n=1 Tax=Clostridium lundense TaxID=319475 RepID=UPI000688B94D|nr:restriction endonuclease subunit S [Clostridium lundense]